MNKEAGLEAEFWFQEQLTKAGIQSERVDEWFDYIVDGKVRVEVKSCQITVRTGKAGDNKFMIGRFDFTEPYNRELQELENIWICFIVRHKKQFLLYGFVEAKKCQGKRYITIHNARRLKPLDLEEWILRAGVNQS